MVEERPRPVRDEALVEERYYEVTVELKLTLGNYPDERTARLVEEQVTATLNGQCDLLRAAFNPRNRIG